MITRGILIWLVIILAEILHGLIRSRFLEPRVGDWRARQIGVFTGSVMIFFISWLSVPWMHASSAAQLLSVGLLWAILTLGFEFLFGRYVARYSWERILSDFNLFKGGFMPLGLIAMGLCPLIAGLLLGVI
jgi:hypothetical protein